MKNSFFFLAIVLLGFLSCRNDNVTGQQIDQVIHLYIDSANQDMLNSKIPNSYTDVKMNDVYGITDNAPVTFSPKIGTTDTIHFIEDVAGARRIRIDSTATFKIYESKIALRLTKKTSATTNAIINDTLTVNYLWTPELFQVSKIWYNNSLKFTKVEGQPNIVKITK